ncbi:MAG TPA: NAD(P)-binding domain-containing protein [Solirubrobacteraceae bacterium]
MRVTVVGTGNMARGVAARAMAGGHHVTFVGTHIGKAEDLADELSGLGDVSASEQVGGDVTVLAVPYTEAPHIVRELADQLDGTVIVDVTNPVDISAFEPLSGAWVEPFNSGAEVIAAEAPDPSKVVKAFNTTFAGTLLTGAVAGQPLDVFIAGDDEEAKAVVSQLARDGGLRPIDAGALRRARELEALGYLHMAVQPALGTGFASAVKVLSP